MQHEDHLNEESCIEGRDEGANLQSSTVLVPEAQAAKNPALSARSSVSNHHHVPGEGWDVD